MPSRYLPAALLACLLALLHAAAAPAQAAPLVTRKPLDVKGKTLRSVSLANLVLQAGIDSPLAFVDDSLRIDLLQHLRGRGYPAVGADDLVHGRDRSSEAELSLGGTITAVECQPNARKRDRCAIAVTWSLLDLASDAVVLEMRATYGEGELLRVPTIEVARRLLRGAADALLARPEFATALATQAAGARSSALQFASLRSCTHLVGAMPADTAKALAATVLIEAGRGSGSGFFVSDDGYVLTAAHVASGGKLTIVTKGGQRVAAEVVRIDSAADVALLRTDVVPESCFDISHGLPETGAGVYAIGAPLGDALSFSLTRGVVSGARRLRAVTMVQTDASVSPGNSGGPLVDEQGRAIALVSSKPVGTAIEGIAFGVALSSAFDVLALQHGNATDAQLKTAAAGTAAQPSAIRVVDDPIIQLRQVDTPLGKREKAIKRKATIMLLTGLGAATAGFITLLAAGDETAPGLTGFGLLCAGTGVAISAPIYRAVARKRARAAEVRVSLSPRHAGLSLRF